MNDMICPRKACYLFIIIILIFICYNQVQGILSIRKSCLSLVHRYSLEDEEKTYIIQDQNRQIKLLNKTSFYYLNECNCKFTPPINEDNFRFSVNMSSSKGEILLKTFSEQNFGIVHEISLNNIQDLKPDLLYSISKMPSSKKFIFSSNNKTTISEYTNGLVTILKNVKENILFENLIFNPKDIESIFKSSSNTTEISFKSVIIELQTIPKITGENFKIEYIEFYGSDSKFCGFKNKISLLNFLNSISESPIKDSLKGIGVCSSISDQYELKSILSLFGFKDIQLYYVSNSD